MLTLPPLGEYGVGVVFLPRDRASRRRAPEASAQDRQPPPMLDLVAAVGGGTLGLVAL